ncbi:MAG: hypothetical protein Q8Q14_07230 [Gemmatimonadales bacterium]|nr:hypothetical protein [Gemmatimonadales bacterium]
MAVIMRRVFAILLVSFPAGPRLALSQAESSLVSLRIDPLLIAEAAEVWTLIAAPENRIWPGWNASDTPLLFYLPGEQDVLINHPRPPEGFVPYTGAVRFPGGRIFVRDGATIIDSDGQNTSRDVAGISTLVVADRLSNLRLNLRFKMRAWLENPRRPEEKAPGFAELATDPYDQLALVVHEAFHVFQGRAAPLKSANEMLLLYYPVLSVENNVGFAQEGAALASALRARDRATLRAGVVKWLALRQQRRSGLRSEAVAYEDGVEFGEGLAKYAEYRLFEVLQGSTPAPAMQWAQGFSGYGDLDLRRDRLIGRMVEHMRGEVPVNNDPYGAAPLRMRLYFSGMAIGALLDRLSQDWKRRILEPGTSLTGLAQEAVQASPSETRHALEEARRDSDYQALVVAKTQLGEAGRARIDAMVEEIEHGEGTGIVVDYAALEPPNAAMAFSPFGITVVDEDRTIFSQVPIKVRLAGGAEVVQRAPRPLLLDKRRKLVRFRLLRTLTREDVDRASGLQATAPDRVTGVALELPEFAFRAPRAQLRWEGKDLRIVLQPPEK